MYLPIKMFSYADCRKEMERLYMSVYDMDDDRLIMECEGVTVGKNVKVNLIIRRYNSYGMPLTNSDKEYLTSYYVLTNCEETLELDSKKEDHMKEKK
jgi:hypothetical protein